MGWELIPLLIFLLAAGFGDTHNPSNASLPIWLSIFLKQRSSHLCPFSETEYTQFHWALFVLNQGEVKTCRAPGPCACKPPLTKRTKERSYGKGKGRRRRTTGGDGNSARARWKWGPPPSLPRYRKAKIVSSVGLGDFADKSGSAHLFTSAANLFSSFEWTI